MKLKHWLPALILLSLGAIFAFTLTGGERTFFHMVRVRQLGYVLLGIGSLFLIWGLVQWSVGRSAAPAKGSSSRVQSLQSIGGLVAVAIGVGAVAGVSVVVVTTVSGLEKTAIVSISTSAFGVISTVVGAYMGIKIGTDQTGEAVDKANATSVALGAATANVPDDQREKAKKDADDAQQIAPGAAAAAPTS